MSVVVIVWVRNGGLCRGLRRAWWGGRGSGCRVLGVGIGCRSMWLSFGGRRRKWERMIDRGDGSCCVIRISLYFSLLNVRSGIGDGSVAKNGSWDCMYASEIQSKEKCGGTYVSEQYRKVLFAGKNCFSHVILYYSSAQFSVCTPHSGHSSSWLVLVPKPSLHSHLTPPALSLGK